MAKGSPSGTTTSTGNSTRKGKGRATPAKSGTSRRAKKARKPKVRPGYTAATADKYHLYELAVQAPDAEIDFVDATFKKLTGRKGVKLREDFCASAATAAEWVKRRAGNTAAALDLEPKILKWAAKNTMAKLNDEQRSRLKLLERNVLTPGDARGMDIVLAMNFSYWIFQERATMVEYFRQVRESLVDDGVFFLDIYGGWEANRTQSERRRCKGFTYVWTQEVLHPISGYMKCRIGFEFKDGTKMERAFSYVWRLWTITEIKDVLADAGFSRVTIYWEGDDGKGGGDGVFRPNTKGEDGASFVCYISAQK